MPTPLSLADPRDETLERSPLRLVVCQVRHDRVAAVADASRALRVHEAIKSDFPKVDQTIEETFNLAAGPNALAANRAEPQLGWRFLSEDGDWTATLSHSHFAIETSAYGRWDGFKNRLTSLTRAVSDVLSPSVELRLGLRMVDHITHPDAISPEGFRGLIVEDLLGPLNPGVLSPSVRSTQALVELEGPEGTTVNLRHGYTIVDGSAGYLLDHDCFRQVGHTFDVDAILRTTDLLHRLAKQVFDAAITDDLYQYLRGGSA